MCDAASRGRQRVGQVHWFFDTPTSGKHPSSVPQAGTEVGGEAVRVLELKAVAGDRIQCEPAFGNRMGENDRTDCWEGGVERPEESRGGKEWVRTCWSRSLPYHEKKKRSVEVSEHIDGDTN